MKKLYQVPAFSPTWTLLQPPLIASTVTSITPPITTSRRPLHLQLLVSSSLDLFSNQPGIGVKDATRTGLGALSGSCSNPAGRHLTGWLQYVTVWDCDSKMLLGSTEKHAHYTSDFTYITPSRHLQKIYEDSLIVGVITTRDEREYLNLLKHHRFLRLSDSTLNTCKVDCSILTCARIYMQQLLRLPRRNKL